MKDLKVRLTDRAMNKFAIMKDGRMELHIRCNKALHSWINVYNGHSLYDAAID